MEQGCDSNGYFNLKTDNMIALQYISSDQTARLLNSSNTIIGSFTSTGSTISSNLSIGAPSATGILTFNNASAKFNSIFVDSSNKMTLEANMLIF